MRAALRRALRGWRTVDVREPRRGEFFTEAYVDGDTPYSAAQRPEFQPMLAELRALRVDVYDIHEDLACVGLNKNDDASDLVCQLLDAQDRLAKILAEVRRHS